MYITEERREMKKSLFITFTAIVCFLAFSFFNHVKNNTRIDIVNIGSATNSVEVIAENATIKSYKDINYNTKNNTYLIIPNSIFYKKQDIKVKVIGNGTLKLYFGAGLGKNLKHKPKDTSGANYKNLVIDGTNIDADLTNKTFENSFVYTKNVKNGDIIEISFKHRFHTIKTFIFIYILLGMLTTVLFALAYFKNTSAKIFGYIKRKLKKITPLHIKAFIFTFSILNIVFLLHTVSYMYGNHDFAVVFNNLHWGSDVGMGRYGAHLIKGFLLQGNYIPILTNIIAFLELALASVLLCIYWKLPKNIYAYCIIGLLLTIQPFTLEWLYYVNSLPEYFITPVLVISGLMLAQNSIKYFKVKNFQFILYNTISIILMNFAIAAYPSLLNTIAVVFLGRIFIESLKWSGDLKSIKENIKYFLVPMLDITFACVIYKAVLIYLDKMGRLLDMYTIKSLPLGQLPQRFIECIKACVVQLYDYNFIFMPFLTELFTVLLIILCCYLLFSADKKSLKTKIIQFAILFATLFVTKTAALIADTPCFYEPRIDFYGLLYFRVLIVAALFIAVKEIEIKRIVAALCALIIAISAINDFNALRIWKISIDGERMFWNRLLARVETTEGFNVNRKYNLIQLGQPKSLREKNLAEISYNPKYTAALMTFSNDPVWAPFVSIQNFYPVNFVEKSLGSIYSYKDEEFLRVINKFNNKGILSKAKPWPDKNSIFIEGNDILVVIDENELNRIKKIIRGK